MGFFTTTRSTKPDCGNCGLYKEAGTPQMGVFGKGNKKILILSKAPNAQQDRMNNLFVGEATQLFAKELEAVGIDLFNDCWMVSALGCYTTRNQESCKKNSKQCYNRVYRYIKEYKPNIIITLGSVALHQLSGGRMSDVNTEAYQGRCYPDYKYNCWVTNLPHPVSLTREDTYGNTLYNDKYYMAFYRRMVLNIISYLEKPLPTYHDISNKVNILTNASEVVRLIDSIIKENPPYIAYDYETNTACSFLPEMRTETVSVAYNREWAYSFPMGRNGVFTGSQFNTVYNKWKELISICSIQKVCHNIGLEANFDAIYFGVENDSYFDTMVACHQLDTTPGTKGLKYQLSMRYGIESYDDDISAYLEPPSMLEYNRIHEVPLNKLLMYNGIDTLGGYWLYEDIRKELKYDSRRLNKQRECNELYQKGYMALCRSHRRGIDLDLDFLAKEEKELEKIRDSKIKSVHESKEGKLYKEKTGHDLEITNTSEIAKLVYEYLDITPLRTTPTGRGQATVEALEELNLPFINDLLEARKIEKHRNDFVSKLLNTNVNGRIYPEIGVSHARTGRSNSFNWNIQQIPKRDKIGKRVRYGIVAPKGYRIVCRDYGGVEVSTNACCSNDPVLKQYIRDGADPHHDNAKLAYLMSDDQVTKEIRQFTKQAWTFLLFYKGYATSSAKRIVDQWEHLLTGDGFTLKEHFAIHGIKNIFDLKDHCVDKADAMWERFKVFHAYQDNKEKEYFEKGYIENPMGFRRGGFITPNMSVNSPAQGLGFQWVLDSYVATDEWYRKNKMKSYLVFQIHDDIVSMVHESELQEVLDHGHWIMTTRLEEKYDHIDIPLTVDTEVSELNGNWYDVKPWFKDEDGIWKPKQ